MAAIPLHGIDSVSARAAGSLLASIWQGALLAGCVAVCLLALRGLSAAVRSVVWMAVLVLAAILPLLPSGLASAAHGMPGPGISGPSISGQNSAFHLDARWSYALLAVWAALSVFRFAQLAWSAWRLYSLRRGAVVVAASAPIQALLSSGGRRAELCVSSEVDRPSVAGFFRPSVLLPPDLLARLPEAELAQVILHEMEHLRRRDDWTNLVQKLALAIFPLNPVLFWLDRRLCLERELACDDGVVRATASRKAYAACLANLAERSLMRRGLSLALGVMGATGTWKPQSEIGRRVMRILRKPEAAMGRRQAHFAASALLAGALAGAVLLGRSPALISFVPQAAPLQAETVMPALPVAASEVRMAKIIPAAFEPQAKPALTRKSTISAPRVRKVLTKERRRAFSAPHLLRAQDVPEQRGAPREVLTSWQGDAAPARLSLMLLEDSQFRYAAVPVRYGWLFIQL